MQDPVESSQQSPKTDSIPEAEANWVDEAVGEGGKEGKDGRDGRDGKESKEDYLSGLSPQQAATLATVETAFLASTASLMWLIDYYFPTGPLLRVFFPLPIALIYLRWGGRSAGMAALVSALLLSVLMGPTRGIFYTIPFGLIGLQLGYLWRRGASWFWSISLGALISALGFFFRFWLLSLMMGEDLWSLVIVQITEFLQWIFLRFGWLQVPEVWLVQVFALVSVVINSFVYLFVVHIVSMLTLDRLHLSIPRPPQWVRILLDYDN